MNTDFFQGPNLDSCSFVGFVARRLGFRTKINSADNGVAELSSVVNPEHCALGCYNQVFHFFLSQRDHADGIQLQALVGEGMAESKSTEEAVGAAPQLKPVAPGQMQRHLKNQQTAGSQDPNHVGNQIKSMFPVGLVLKNHGGINEIGASIGERLQITCLPESTFRSKLPGHIQHAGGDINAMTFGEVIAQSADQPSQPAAKIDGMAMLP